MPDLTPKIHVVEANDNQFAKLEDAVDRLAIDLDDFLDDDVYVYYASAGTNNQGDPNWGRWFNYAHSGDHVARCIHIAPGIGTSEEEQKYTFGHEIGHIIANDCFTSSDRDALKALMTPTVTGGWKEGPYKLIPSECFGDRFPKMFGDFDAILPTYYERAIPPANYAAAIAIVEASIAGDGDDPEPDPEEDLPALTLIGQNGKPGGDFTENYGSTFNQAAELLTIPTRGRILLVGQWIAAVGSDTTIRMCVWSKGATVSSGNNLLAQSAALTITARAWAAGNVDLYEADLETPELDAGTQVYVGFSRDIDGEHQLTGRNSGSHIDRRRSTWPGPMDDYQLGGHGFGDYAIGSFAYLARPAGFSVRRSGVWVRSSAVRVRRSGQWVDASAVRVRRSGQWVDAD